MSVARVGISVFGMVALLAAVLAAATIWLMLTDPVTVVDAVNDASVSPLVQALATFLYEALRDVLRYL